ncbi:hypothetical protein MHOL44478_26850 [Mycobacterium holsaticum DSM 44478]|nr:hypothetical protein [Mycolicibacterium holsaticum DSM 44478 = JCM 12374]
MALAPEPIATAVLKNPNEAFAVAPGPIAIAIVVMLLEQPLPLFSPKAEKHVALAAGAPLTAPVAMAVETANAPNNDPRFFTRC